MPADHDRRPVSALSDAVHDTESTGFKSRFVARASQDFANEERDGLELAAKVRLGILGVTLIWLAIDLPMTGIAYAYELAMVSVFAVTGVAHLLCARRAILLPYSIYGLFAFDIAFLGVIYSHTNPFIEFPEYSPSLFLLIPNFIWFFIILMQSAFALTPRLVIWCGLCILTARAAQFAYIWFQGDFYSEAALTIGDWEPWIVAWYDPRFISIKSRISEAIFTLGMTAGLAAIVQRSRDLVLKRVTTERARASLARYFSPNVVDAVTVNREEVDTVRVADVAVMFVDIKGFTSLCERIEPNQIANLLREYYGRLTEVIFSHNGTLDKFLGDGVMATFGTPTPRPGAPAEALACAIAIVEDIARWNDTRQSDGHEPVAISIGLHYGAALVGNIGDERRMEYAVVGDTVNVASRVEGLTRQLDSSIAVTDDCVAAVKQSSDRHEHLLQLLTGMGEYPVKGREKPVRIWSADLV